MGREKKKKGFDTLSRKRSANRLRQLRESTVLTGQVVTLTRKYCLRLRAIRAARAFIYFSNLFAGCSSPVRARSSLPLSLLIIPPFYFFF